MTLTEQVPVTDPDKLASVLKRILSHINRTGVSYDNIAIRCNLNDGAYIRTFLTRPVGKRGYSVNNKTIKNINTYVFDNLGDLSRILPSNLMEEYCHLIPSDMLNSIIYPRVSSDRKDSIAASYYSEITHDFFRTKFSDCLNLYKKIGGRYYCYRNSSEKGHIVRSIIDIDLRKGGSDFVLFTHYHPDRYFSKKRGDIPRITFGIVIRIGNNVFFLGSIGYDQGMSYFAMREPFEADFHLMVGFTITLNLDRNLLGARTVFVRDNEARIDNIDRVPESEIIEDIAGFDKSLLVNSIEPHHAECVADIR